MKRLIYIFSILLATCTAIPAGAVTDKEMEQARTIAAHTYLRFANDGSGYLDESHPKTMAELERLLKPKEKENLKAFKAIGVPKDYANWDKAKLVEYWGSTVFSSKGLLEKGKIGKSRAKKKLNAMSVAAPKPASEKSDKKTEQAPAKEAKEKPATDEQAPAAKPATPAAARQEANDSVALAMSEAEASVNATLDQETEDIPKAKDNTWIYIVILCVLVAIVVALVVFASNVMKKNGGNTSARQSDEEDVTADNAGIQAVKEKYAASLNAKNNEIQNLNKKVEDLSKQNQTLKTNLDALTAETASLRTRLTEATRKLAAVSAAASSSPIASTTAAPQPQAAPQEATPAPQPLSASQPQRTQQPKAAPQATSLRTIFLGRANAKGIFVRADRTLNIGNSIYRLDTTDGYAGTFRVVNDPTVWEMAMLTPRESLSGACVCADFDNTEGKERIMNDSSGTAIFEGGCWKVIRKAKIHFE